MDPSRGFDAGYSFGPCLSRLLSLVRGHCAAMAHSHRMKPCYQLLCSMACVEGLPILPLLIHLSRVPTAYVLVQTFFIPMITISK